MFKKLLLVLLSITAVGIFSTPANAVTLIVDNNGTLMGATNVSVDGKLYDVEFANGSCVSLFNGCDSIDDFTFTTKASAILAAEALLADVFMDGPQGNFDTVPSLTFGCSDDTECQTLTPYDIDGQGTFVLSPYALNHVDEADGVIPDAQVPVIFDVTDSTAVNFALWTLVVTIDIKPGSDPNSVNPKSKGVIPVAVLGSIDFDSTQADFTTVTFGPDGATPAHDGHVEDVNDDGFMDAVFHFKTQDTGIVCGDTEATLSGEIFDSTPISGTDTVNSVGCNSVEGAGAINWIMLIGLSVVGLWRSNRRRKAN